MHRFYLSIPRDNSAKALPVLLLLSSSKRHATLIRRREALQCQQAKVDDSLTLLGSHLSLIAVFEVCALARKHRDCRAGVKGDMAVFQTQLRSHPFPLLVSRDQPESWRISNHDVLRPGS